MRRITKFFRISQDEQTKEIFRSVFYCYPEQITAIEGYPYEDFEEKFPGPKCYAYFADGRVVILHIDPIRLSGICNGTNIAFATGRTSLINLS